MTVNYGGTWASDGTMAFSVHGILLPLFREARRPEAPPHRQQKLKGADWAHLWPSFLPGRPPISVQSEAFGPRAAEASEHAGIYLGSLRQLGKSVALMPDLSSAVYAPPGYIVFVRAMEFDRPPPFDLATGDVGQPARRS